jgi:hypothetical protein
VAERRGLSTLTPEGDFLIGDVPGVPGLYIATGCCVTGISAAPVLGRLLSRVERRWAPVAGYLLHAQQSLWQAIRGHRDPVPGLRSGLGTLLRYWLGEDLRQSKGNAPPMAAQLRFHQAPLRRIFQPLYGNQARNSPTYTSGRLKSSAAATIFCI